MIKQSIVSSEILTDLGVANLHYFTSQWRKISTDHIKQKNPVLKFLKKLKILPGARFIDKK